MKQAKHRRDQFSQGSVSQGLPPSAVSGHHQGSVLLADEQVSIDLEPRNSMLMPVQMQAQAIAYDDTVSKCFSKFWFIYLLQSLKVFRVLSFMFKMSHETFRFVM